MGNVFIKDVAAGAIGVLSVLSLAAIAILELFKAQPFSEPASLTAIATASVFYFFGRASNETVRDVQSSANETVRAMSAAGPIGNGHGVEEK